MAGLPVAQRFLDALGQRDFETIETCFDPEVRFRAITPNGPRDHDDAAGAAGRLRLWFGELDPYEVVSTELDEVVDRIRVGYRIRGTDPDDGAVVVEQQAYLETSGDRIVTVSLACSGFRPG